MVGNGIDTAVELFPRFFFNCDYFHRIAPLCLQCKIPNGNRICPPMLTHWFSSFLKIFTIYITTYELIDLLNPRWNLHCNEQLLPIGRYGQSMKFGI
jgi:hypothetical protein